MLEPLPAALGVSILNRVAEPPGGYVPVAALADRDRLKAFVALARRFSGIAHDDVRLRSAASPASADLSIAALRGAAPAGPARWLLLAQSEADRAALATPLARVHEEAAPPCQDHFGLTHLGANAAVDSLVMLAWLLAPEEQALLVLTDQPVLAREHDGRAAAGDSCVVLSVRHGEGPLRVCATGQDRWPDEAFATPATFDARLEQDLARMLEAGWISAVDPVVVQNLFGDGTIDLGSGDVWHQLHRLLDEGAVAPGEQVLLVATSGVRRVSYALVAT